MNVEVRVTDHKGKGLFAVKDIKSDNVIFEEDPLVCCQFSWNAAYQYRACDHCLRPLETAEENVRRLTSNNHIVLPYPECCITNKNSITICNTCGVEYCSSECRDKAYNQYHRTLCLQTFERNNTHPLERLNEAWKHVHYPPETNSIMLLVRLLATIKQSENPMLMSNQILQFCHRTTNEDAELTHKLLGERFEKDRQLLFNLLLECIDHTDIEQFLTPEGFLSLLALIGTNGQGVGTSPISQWVTRTSELALSNYHREELDKLINKLYEEMDAHSGNFLNNEGVALFSLQSACNHSCAPNAEPTYLHNNSRLSLVALRDIQAGEEICISYLDECTLQRSRHSRQRELKENYLFVCNCPRCEEQIQEVDVTSDEEEMSE